VIYEIDPKTGLPLPAATTWDNGNPLTDDRGRPLDQDGKQIPFSRDKSSVLRDVVPPTVDEIADAVVARLNVIPRRFFNEFATLGHARLPIPTSKGLMHNAEVRFTINGDILTIEFAEHHGDIVARMQFRKGDN
jgi:hypothetical protein